MIICTPYPARQDSDAHVHSHTGQAFRQFFPEDAA